MAREDWVLEPQDDYWLEEYDHLPFRTAKARSGYPTKEAAEERRKVVLDDLARNWDIYPSLLVVSRPVVSQRSS